MPEEKTCFVVCAIGSDGEPERLHADWVLEEIIRPVMAEFPDFTVVRADQIDSPGLIDAQIIDKLLTAELVIADLTFLNPNVFYEIGIRHVAQKPIIHMNRVGEKVPFDVSLYRYIGFQISEAKHLKDARAQLTAAAKVVLADGYEVENPVTKARGKVQFEANATPADQVLREELASISSRLAAVESYAHRSLPRPVKAPLTKTTLMGSGPDPEGDLRSLYNEFIIPVFGSAIVSADFDKTSLNLTHGVNAISKEAEKALEFEAEKYGVTLLPF